MSSVGSLGTRSALRAAESANRSTGEDLRESLRLKEYDTGDINGFVRFCNEVLKVDVYSKQRQIAQSYLEKVERYLVKIGRRIARVVPPPVIEPLTGLARALKRRTAVKSGHSVGKTMICACICEYHFSVLGLCYLSTAPGMEAVKGLLWKQIRTNRQGATRNLPGEINDSCELKVKGCDDWWGKGFSTNKPERGQGKHSPGLLVIADEAAGLAPFVWEALDSSMASEGATMLVIGNPNYEKNRFWHAFHEDIDLYDTFTISSYDSPNVTGECEIFGLATLAWINEQKHLYRHEPDKFRCRILGEWPMSDATDKAVPMDYVLAAQKLWVELEEEEPFLEEEPQIHCAFLDVAGWGKDWSILTYLKGQRFHFAIEENDKTDEGLMKLAEATNRWICALPAHQKPRYLQVDCDAVGAGVFSRLAQLRKANVAAWGRCQLKKFNWGGASNEPTKFFLAVDEAFWKLREALDPTKPRHERLAIPPSDLVAKQVNMRKYTEDIRERKKVENKEQLDARNAGSLDYGDSIAGNCFKPRITQVRGSGSASQSGRSKRAA